MSDLPQSVQRQIDAANKHFETPQNPETDPAATGDDSAPQDDRNPQGGQDDSQNGSQGAPDNSDQPDPTETRDARYWEHRFRVVKGKYDAEVPALRQENADLQKRVEQLEASQGDGQGSLTNNEVQGIEQLKEEYGEDLIAMVQTIAEQSSGGSNEDLQAIKERLERDDEERRQDAEARFWSRLEERVPNYLEINADQNFLNWLGNYDRLRGVTHQQLLIEAQQATDAERVADIFDTYLQESGAQPSQAREIPDDQVQPRQSRSTQAPRDERIWTREEINRFYREKRDGRYSDEEAKRLEADIFQAMNQGRVR